MLLSIPLYVIIGKNETLTKQIYMETDCLNTGTDKLLVDVKDWNTHTNIIDKNFSTRRRKI